MDPMGTATPSAQLPNPSVIFDALNAYQRSFALKAAIEYDLFTKIGQGNNTPETLANAAGASVRGVRILCDFLVIGGLLTKSADRYGLTIDSATFLDRNSPAYFGIASEFLLDQRLIAPFFNLGEVVRTGRTTLPGDGTVSTENPLWIGFAKQMAPLVHPAALEVAELMNEDGPLRVLDIAAGHGLFGIAIAQRNREARIAALDWPGVLAVATENAHKFGVADRHTLLPGDAFQVDLGGPYDLVLVTNFFHHFDRPTCERLMRRIHAALTSGGRCVNLDFIPNGDRVSPPGPAAFAMMMLGTTVAGDVYTFDDYETMFRNAGFSSTEFRPLTRAPQALTISTKA